MLPALLTRVTHARNALHDRFAPPVLILLYHRVAEQSGDPQQLAVSPENFRAQLTFLQRNYPICRFEDDWGKHRGPAVAITFDDGYADNLLEALPILTELDVPATVFVTTSPVFDGGSFWWDELESLLLADESGVATFHLRDREHERVWPTATTEERISLYRDLHRLMLGLDNKRRGAWLQQVLTWCGAACVDRSTPALTPEQLRELAASPLITIGAHTCSHTRLSVLSAEQQYGEIAGSRQQLEGWTGKPVPVFSYPFGTARDFTATSRDLCRSLGFVKAAANIHGCARHWTDPYRIPRCLVRNWTLEHFTRYVEQCWKL